MSTDLAPHPPTAAIGLVAVLKALADPTRLEILEILDARGEQTCGVLAAQIGMPMSTLSNHLRQMREAGLLHSRRDATLRWASIRHEDLEERFPGLLSSITAAISTSVAV